MQLPCAVGPVTGEMGNDGHWHCGSLNVNNWARTQTQLPAGRALLLHAYPWGIDAPTGKGNVGKWKWVDRWNNWEMKRCNGEQENNTGVDEMRAELTIGPSYSKKNWFVHISHLWREPSWMCHNTCFNQSFSFQKTKRVVAEQTTKLGSSYCKLINHHLAVTDRINTHICDPRTWILISSSQAIIISSVSEAALNKSQNIKIQLLT